MTRNIKWRFSKNAAVMMLCVTVLNTLEFVKRQIQILIYFA